MLSPVVEEILACTAVPAEVPTLAFPPTDTPAVTPDPEPADVWVEAFTPTPAFTPPVEAFACTVVPAETPTEGLVLTFTVAPVDVPSATVVFPVFVEVPVPVCAVVPVDALTFAVVPVDTPTDGLAPDPVDTRVEVLTPAPTFVEPTLAVVPALALTPRAVLPAVLEEPEAPVCVAVVEAAA